MNRVTQQVESVVAEAVGEFVARATVKKNCEVIGTTPDTLTPAQLPELAEKIAKSITFFSDKEKGSVVAQKVKAIGV